MTYQNVASSMLESGAAAYAGFATTLLFETRPDLESRYEPSGFRTWKNLLTNIVMELAVALDLESPPLFVFAVNWSRQSFVVREVPLEDLRAGLASLQRALGEELPDSVKAQVDAYFEIAEAAFEDQAAVEMELDAASEPGQLAVAYMEACISGRPRKARRLLLEAVDAGLPVEDAYLKVLVPAQQEVGRLWHKGDIGVHEEHVVTATTESLLTLLSYRDPSLEENGKTVVAAAVENNMHDVGVRVVSEFFAIHGWNAICLGGSLPAADLAQAAHDFEAHLVVLSVTLTSQLKHLRGSVAAVREAVPEAKILLGGRALAVDPEIWPRVGADGYAANPDEAIRMAHRMVVEPG